MRAKKYVTISMTPNNNKTYRIYLKEIYNANVLDGYCTVTLKLTKSSFFTKNISTLFLARTSLVSKSTAYCRACSRIANMLIFKLVPPPPHMLPHNTLDTQLKTHTQHSQRNSTFLDNLSPDVRILHFVKLQGQSCYALMHRHRLDLNDTSTYKSNNYFKTKNL